MDCQLRMEDNVGWGKYGEEFFVERRGVVRGFQRHSADISVGRGKSPVDEREVVFGVRVSGNPFFEIELTKA